MSRSMVLVMAAVAGGVAMVGGAGCDTVRAPGTSYADPLPPSAYPQIEAAEGLQGFIVNNRPIVSNDRIMSVSVPLRAATEYEDLRVQYRFLFYDKAGRTIGDEPSWRYVKLASRRETQLSGNALDAGAVDWRLQLRPAR